MDDAALATLQGQLRLIASKTLPAGDLTYGADPVLAKRLGLERQWLHAVRLGFVHPVTGEKAHFSAPLPSDMAQLLEILRIPV